MSNTVLTPSVVAKMALAILDNDLGFMNSFYRGYEDEYSKNANGYKIGDTVSIRRPADFTVRTGANMSVQDVIEGKTSITVDQQIGVDFRFKSIDLTLSMNQLAERVMRPAMTDLVNHMAADVLDVYYKGTYNWVGTPGNLIDSIADFNRGPERLDEMTVPTAGRNALLSTSDHYAMVDALAGKYVENVARGAIRKGDIGELAGVDTMRTQVVPTHVVGDYAGSPLTRGAGQNVSYDTAKNTWSMDLSTDGWTGDKVLKKGDVFTIGSTPANTVYMVNAKTKKKTDIPQQFVILEDKTTASSGSNETLLKVSPPIITSGPHQTVDKAPDNDIAIVVKGTANTGYRQNLFYTPNAYGLVVVPMELPQGAVNPSRQTYKGWSVRVIPVYTGSDDNSAWRLDLLYGRTVLDPRLATRASG